MRLDFFDGRILSSIDSRGFRLPRMEKAERFVGCEDLLGDAACELLVAADTRSHGKSGGEEGGLDAC